MAKIRNYDTREVAGITNDEYAVITDYEEQVTYKVNLTDYILSMSGSSGGYNGSLLTQDKRRVTIEDGVVKTVVDETYWIDCGTQSDWQTIDGVYDSGNGMFYLDPSGRQIEYSRSRNENIDSSRPKRIRVKTSEGFVMSYSMDRDYTVVAYVPAVPADTWAEMPLDLNFSDADYDYDLFSVLIQDVGIPYVNGAHNYVTGFQVEMSRNVRSMAT